MWKATQPSHFLISDPKDWGFLMFTYPQEVSTWCPPGSYSPVHFDEPWQPHYLHTYMEAIHTFYLPHLLIS